MEKTRCSDDATVMKNCMVHREVREARIDDKQRIAPGLVRSTFHSTFAVHLRLTPILSYIVTDCHKYYPRYALRSLLTRSNNRIFVNSYSFDSFVSRR